MDKHLHQSKDNHLIPVTSVAAGTGQAVAEDVYYYTGQIVNLIFYRGTTKPSMDNGRCWYAR